MKINMRETMSIEELRKAIPIIGKTLTPVVISEPGVGKTSLLNMMEEDLGDAYDYIYVDCPVKDMSDIGMVIPNHETKTLEYYVASLFKLDSPKPKVICLDELMKAPKLLQVIFTRMMLERMVGDKPLTRGQLSLQHLIIHQMVWATRCWPMQGIVSVRLKWLNHLLSHGCCGHQRMESIVQSVLAWRCTLIGWHLIGVETKMRIL